MPKVLSTMNISQGFARWTEMAKTLAPEMEKVGAKMLWAGTNPDETQAFVLMELQDMSQMQTFGEREDIAKARAEAGTALSSVMFPKQVQYRWWRICPLTSSLTPST